MEELDLKELFRIFWNKKIQIILIILIFMVMGVIYTVGFVTPMYSSSTTLVLASSGDKTTSKQETDASITATEITVNSKLVGTYSEIVTSKSVLRTVISNLNIDIDEDVLKRNIKVSSVKNTEVIQITVSDQNQYYAEKIANEIAEVFIEKVKDIYKIENVQILDTAEVSYEPSNINYKRDVAIFASIGFVVAVMYVLIMNMLDTTIKTVEDIENVYQIPVLVSIPIYEENTQKNKKGGRR